MKSFKKILMKLFSVNKFDLKNYILLGLAVTLFLFFFIKPINLI